MTMGVLIAVYTSLQGKANGYDCQSRFIGVSLGLIGISTYFNKPFLLNQDEWLFWAGFVLNVGLQIYAITLMSIQCSRDYTRMVDSGWWEDFNFLAKEPIVGVTYREETYIWWNEMLNVIFLGLGAYSLYG